MVRAFPDGLGGFGSGDADLAGIVGGFRFKLAPQWHINGLLGLALRLIAHTANHSTSRDLTELPLLMWSENGSNTKDILDDFSVALKIPSAHGQTDQAHIK